ncbi:DNA endonuclease RBBP8 isoform X2 [Synchiropus splendidus]|uniref:DNA endonuclease RBBP8 isoform X2 n=1 Tax=Synchiropus splendidus TaxID=270530 RepID=UPI00237DD903|nr:DNA endonuclease RBBP8 isoform X2 [Synchiropus splendidus]
MSSPDLSNRSTAVADLFQDLYRQLGKCHDDALQELQEKVSKLKRERSLDAQKLEVYYKRNQQLKEQNKSLQEAVNLLDDRLKTSDCVRCGKLEENLKNSQELNESIIRKLKAEINNLEYENQKLHARLQKLNAPKLQSASSPDAEDGIIPDSPVLASSLPVSNKLKKRKNSNKPKHVRYLEIPLSSSSVTFFSDLKKESDKVTKAEVLVPNTCELEASPVFGTNIYDENMVIAETCALELHSKPRTKPDTAQQKNTKAAQMADVRMNITSFFPSKPHHSSSSLIHSPHSTTAKSPSLLTSIKRGLEIDAISKAKRVKEGSEDEVEGKEESVMSKRVKKLTETEADQRSSKGVAEQSFKETSGSKEKSEPGRNINQTVNSGSPEFKKPNRTDAAHRRSDAPGGDQKHDVEPMWSIDPALALSMYESEPEKEETQACNGELEDSDCTWISHSVLQEHSEHDQDHAAEPGIGEKANDSLERMFDTSECGEYRSYNCSELGQNHRDGDDDDEKDEDHGSPESSPSFMRRRKDGQATFAHVAVVRKKEERRKLKGTTCKECEIYYAHLPEEEKQKKLGACSRHRFQYLPPATPENFWEVGFPSTQTCIDRGYIHEETNPQARMRRRQPFNALFSQKKKQPETQTS